MFWQIMHAFIIFRSCMFTINVDLSEIFRKGGFWDKSSIAWVASSQPWSSLDQVLYARV